MKYNVIIPVLFVALQFVLLGCNPVSNKEKVSGAREVWSIEKAKEWGENTPWFRGANFNPSTAINQLETWQEETFDLETIDRELGWAEEIGFNLMRVYLHHLAWQVDKEGFKSRLDSYLEVADSHGIKTMFVFFDDCWNPTYAAGKQPDPKPGVHNSGWVQDPGILIFEDPTLMDTLELYVKDVLTTFAEDDRVLVWDLYNEPGNQVPDNKSMPLLKNVFRWGREVNPSQPLTVGVWTPTLTELNKYQLENSDIITYHNYGVEELHRAAVDSLKAYNRPLICTEYMARSRGSRFENIMPLLKENNVGAINWGLVSGKSNTIYAWDSPMPDGGEPVIWFHDIFRQDGTVFDQSEIELIKKLTGEAD
ncbi:MAG: cellulase family glycosylhydrolase [Bacteroidota bacterium]